MTRHLSPEQFALYVLGERDRAAEAHLLECSVCRSEIQRFQLSTSDLQCYLQAASANYAQDSVLAETTEGKHSSGKNLRHVRFAAVVAAILLICILWNRTRHQTPAPNSRPPVQTQATAEADSDLWQDLEDQTSETSSPALNLLLGTAQPANPSPGQSQ